MFVLICTFRIFSDDLIKIKEDSCKKNLFQLFQEWSKAGSWMWSTCIVIRYNLNAKSVVIKKGWLTSDFPDILSQIPLRLSQSMMVKHPFSKTILAWTLLIDYSLTSTWHLSLSLPNKILSPSFILKAYFLLAGCLRISN